MSISNVDFHEVAPPGVVALAEVAVRLHEEDDVAVAKSNLQFGMLLALDPSERPEHLVPVRRFIPAGHKVALRDLAPGAPVRRYRQVIGFASGAIPAGEHVHSHNLHAGTFDREYRAGADVSPVDYVPPEQRRLFEGYLRADGRVGTRNYITILPTVNCSAHTVRAIAQHFTPERLAPFENIDGVIALAHLSGCGNRIGGDDYVLLQRTLAGMARHPNVGAYLLVGLGCEANQLVDLSRNYGLTDHQGSSITPPHLVIQETGGVRKTVQAGIEAVEALLPGVNNARRTAQPLSELVLALQCGGSDSWSGVTANPVVGRVADEVVRQGGTVVLAETPEIYGAEHLLTRRACSSEIAGKLIAQVRWWEQHTRRHGIEIDNNPSPGNKAGGLTTIYEKSLGAVAKGGTTPLMGVFDYAEPVTTRGFTFMNTPGYDPVSVTGQVAGGCNLVLFTTGRGSMFGFKPAPSIKITSNSSIFTHLADDMDFDAGKILEGATIEQVAGELLDLVIQVASGTPSKSEAQGIGETEFNPWNLGGTL
jgi:altronate hydrolase